MEPLKADQLRATWRQIEGVKDRLNNLSPTAKQHIQTIYRDGRDGISLKIESKRRWFIARGLLAIGEHYEEETEPWMFTCITFHTGDHVTPIPVQLARLDLLGSDNYYRLCMDVVTDELYPIFDENRTYWQRS